MKSVNELFDEFLVDEEDCDAVYCLYDVDQIHVEIEGLVKSIAKRDGVIRELEAKDLRADEQASEDLREELRLRQNEVSILAHCIPIQEFISKASGGWVLVEVTSVLDEKTDLFVHCVLDIGPWFSDPLIACFNDYAQANQALGFYNAHAMVVKQIEEKNAADLQKLADSSAELTAGVARHRQEN